MSADRSPPYCPACGLTKPCATCGKPHLGVVPDSIEQAGDAIAEAMAEIEKAKAGLVKVEAEKERYRLAYESAQSALEDAQAGRPLQDCVGRHDAYTLTVEKLRTLKVECRAIAVRLEAAGFASVADLVSEVERLKAEAIAEAHLGTVLADQLAAEKIAHLATWQERDGLRADLARVSEEFDLPPLIGPAPGEIRKLRALATPKVELLQKWAADLPAVAEHLFMNATESNWLFLRVRALITGEPS